MKLCVVNTGGTISSVGEPLAPMAADQFAEVSEKILGPILAATFPDTQIDYETELRFPESESGTLDSTNLQPSDWVLMAEYILDNYDAYDGFIILHGTDSMDFTGSALPFLLNVFDAQGFGRAVLSKPVIITGSQVPMYAYVPDPKAPKDKLPALNFNTDAYQNVCGAIACARLGIPEVGVYFDGYLFRGNRVLKINASEFRAFNSPNYPPLAEYGIRLTHHPDRILPGPVGANVSLSTASARQLAINQLTAIKNDIDTYPAMQFSAFPAHYSTGSAVIAKLIDAAVETGIKGLILQSYGEGNFPSGNPKNAKDGAIFHALDRATKADVVIIDCTQVIAGTVDDSAYAAGAWLPDVGALSGSDMTPMAGLAKAILLRAAARHNGWTLDEVRRLIMLNLCGEVMNVSWLDSRENDQLQPGQSIMALDGNVTLINDPIAGPLLQNSKGELLWAPFGSRKAGQPGRLVMQGDGNLVLYDGNSTPIWAANTDVSGGMPSVLMISGSYAKNVNLRLSIYNYVTHTETKVLYPQT